MKARRRLAASGRHHEIVGLNAGRCDNGVESTRGVAGDRSAAAATSKIMRKGRENISRGFARAGGDIMVENALTRRRNIVSALVVAMARCGLSSKR